MKRSLKIIIIVLILLVVMYIMIPVVIGKAFPFHVIRLNGDAISCIEVRHWDRTIKIDDRAEIERIVNQINHTKFILWIPRPPFTGSDYLLRIYYDNNVDLYAIGPKTFTNKIIYSADMSFITTDIIPYTD